MRKKLLYIAMFPSIGLASASLWADDEQAYQLDTITVESKAVQASLGNSLIDELDIERNAPTSLKDVFKGNPAIGGTGGSAPAQKVLVNGIEESLMSVTIDGATQNKGGWHHAGNVLLDPQLLKQVEVSSGLAPADAGPGALAGTIAYTLKSAEDLLDPGENVGALVSVTMDTNDINLRANTAVFGRNSNGFDYLFSVTKDGSGRYEDAAGDEQPNTNTDLMDYVGKLSYETESSVLQFSASHTVDDAERGLTAAPGWSGLTLPFARIEDSRDITGYGKVKHERTSATLKYDSTATEGMWNPRFLLSYNIQTPDAYATKAEMTNTNLTVANRSYFESSELHWGLDWSKSKGEQTQGGGIWDGGEGEEITNIGIFAQNRQELSDTVSASYGARFDAQDFHGNDGTKLSDEGVSVNGSIAFELTDSLTANVGAASTWGGYEIGEAVLYSTTGFVPFSLDPTSYGSGSSVMKPSTSNSGRLGLTYETDQFTSSASLFSTSIKDISAMTYDRSESTDVKSTGYQISLAVPLSDGRFFTSFADIDVTEDGDDISTTSYYNGRPIGQVYSAGFDWVFSDSIEANFSLEGARDLTLDTGTVIDGYNAIHVAAIYQPLSIDGLTLRFFVNNLTDEEYELRGTAQAGSTGSTLAINEPGRTLGLTASYKF